MSPGRTLHLEGEDDILKSLGKRFRAAREAQELTQADAAERIGISAEFYARMERGHARPSLAVFMVACQVLDLSTDAALGDAPLTIKTSRGPDPDPPPLRRLLRDIRSAPPDCWRALAVLIKAWPKNGQAQPRGFDR